MIWPGNGKFKIITNQKLRMGKNVRKIVDANRDEKDEEKRKELQLDDKGISSLTDIDNNLSKLSHLTRLILAHNRLTKITQGNSRDPCIGIRKWRFNFFRNYFSDKFSGFLCRSAYACP